MNQINEQAKSPFQSLRHYPIRFILLYYLACFIFRGIEYFIIRTDQSVIGEAFIHKLAGIVLLAGAVRYLGYKWRDIGFRADSAVKGTCIGFMFGTIIYAVAYGAEMLVHTSVGNAPGLRFYVSSYAIEVNRTMQGGMLFVLICIIGNIINVVMEEGVFRGLFVRLAEQKYSFAKACAASSLLFGFWHIIGPVRNALDGAQSPAGAAMMALMLVVTSALAGIQYVMLLRLSGALWVPMAAHFVNNASVNLLHVVTATGADELMTMRISIAQSLSFIIVLIIFLHKWRSRL